MLHDVTDTAPGAMPFIRAEPGLMTYHLNILGVGSHIRAKVQPCLVIRCEEQSEEIYLSLKAR